MKIGVYFCNCGTNISDKVDPEKVKEKTLKHPDVAYFKTFEFMCSEEGKEFLGRDLIEEKPERVVIATCSPRDHESTFMIVETYQTSATEKYQMSIQALNLKEFCPQMVPRVEKLKNQMETSPVL